MLMAIPSTADITENVYWIMLIDIVKIGACRAALFQATERRPG
jgi:hypothetical protein